MQAQNTIKMIASFNRGIFIPLIGQHEQPVAVHNLLKEKGARVSLEHVRALMEGREREFKDFEVLQVLGHNGPVQPTQQMQAAAVRRPQMPSGLPGRLVTPGMQTANLQSPAPARARGRGREYLPNGAVKPLKRGTVYAKLMEMLLTGATMKELLAAAGNDTAGGVNDVLSWQIKQRGYGLTFDQDSQKYFLLLPEGHKTLTYQN